MEYIFIALIVLILYQYEYNIYKKPKWEIKTNKKRFSFNFSYLAMFLLIVFAGLRSYDIGAADLFNYKDNYDLLVKTKSIFGGHDFEPLFQLINFIPAMIFGDEIGFCIMLLISETIIVLCVNYAAKKISPEVAITMFLFVTVDIYFRGFGQLRQNISIAILMVATVFIIKKRLFPFILSVLFAAFFHKSALIFLPFYFLNIIKFRYINYIVVIVITAIFSVFCDEIMQIVCSILHLNSYANYISSGFGKETITIVGILELVSYLLIFIFLFSYRIYYFKKFKEVPRNYDLFMNIFFFAVMANIVSVVTQEPLVYGRLVYTFFWAIIFIVPIFLNSIKNVKIKKVFYSIIIIVGFLYLSLGIFVVNAYGIYPYKSILLR